MADTNPPAPAQEFAQLSIEKIYVKDQSLGNPGAPRSFRLEAGPRILGPEECRSVPVTDQIAEEVLSLPMYPALADADVGRVAEALREVVSSGAAARNGTSNKGGEHAELARLAVAGP